MKNKKGLLILIIVILFLLLVVSLKFIFNDTGDNLEAEGNGVVDTDKGDTVLENIQDITISYSGEVLNLDDYVSRFNTSESSKGKLLELTVDKMILNDKEYVFKLKNHPQSCLDLVANDTYTKEHNTYYINDTLIYTQNNQSCYLEGVYLLTVIDDSYIGISFRGQGGNYMKIYNEKIELVDTLNYLDVKVENNNIIYTEYEENNGCLINNYSYKIVDGEAVKTLLEQTSNSVCNEMTGEGCCNY